MILLCRNLPSKTNDEIRERRQKGGLHEEESKKKTYRRFTAQTDTCTQHALCEKAKKCKRSQL